MGESAAVAARLKRRPYSHHRRNSSITSINPSATGSHRLIQKRQSFEKWRTERSDICADFNPASININWFEKSDEDGKWYFYVECSCVDGNWVCQKGLADFYLFQAELETVFPLEAGKTGKSRALPRLPVVRIPNAWMTPWLLQYYRRKLNRFIDKLSGLGVLINRSNVVADFFKSNICTEESFVMRIENQKSRRVQVSEPFIEGERMQCELKTLTLKKREIIESSFILDQEIIDQSININEETTEIKVRYQDDIYLLFFEKNTPKLAELVIQMMFVIGDSATVTLSYINLDGKQVFVKNDDDLLVYMHECMNQDKNIILNLEI